MTAQTNDSKFSCSKWIVDANGLDSGATHITIQGAIDDAVSGDTVFIKPSLPAFAAYDEDITLKSGVNLVGFNNSGFSGVQAEILGKVTLGSATDCSVKNILIMTQSDYAIEDTGASAGSIRFLDCSIRIDSTGGINLDNANRTLTFNNCQHGRVTNSLKDFNVTSVSMLTFEYCVFSGATTTGVASTIAAGTLGMRFCLMNRHAVGLSGTAVGDFDSVFINASTDNLLGIDFDGGTSTAFKLDINSGTAAGINIGTGVIVSATGLSIRSSNSDAISGDGTLIGPGSEFYGSSSVIASAITWSTGAVNYRTVFTEGISFDGGTSTLSNFIGRTAFTPVLEGAGGNPTPTYTFQVGFYQRVGNAVFISINLRISEITGGSGTLRIGDLPFTSANVANMVSFFPFGVNSLTSVATGGSLDGIIGFINPNTDFMVIQEVTPEAAFTDIDVADVTASTTITFETSGWYWVT